MPSTTSVPNIQIQPNELLYGLNSLALFTSYSSIDSYTKAFGIPPSPYNFALPPKTWFDTSVGQFDHNGVLLNQDDGVIYTVVKALSTGGYAIKQLAMSVGEAVNVNIPPADANIAHAVDNPNPVFHLGRAREMPIRPLMPNEVLTQSPFGFLFSRVDYQQSADEAAGKFTTNDRKLLTEIHQKLFGN